MLNVQIIKYYFGILMRFVKVVVINTHYNCLMIIVGVVIVKRINANKGILDL